MTNNVTEKLTITSTAIGTTGGVGTGSFYGNAITTWRCANELRWNVTGLEQAWMCMENGNVEWRKVPTVNEPKP